MGKWGNQPCEVTEVEPERLLAYTFAEGSSDTTIVWRLEPEGVGTRLFLQHKGFDLDTPMGRRPTREWAAVGPGCCAGSTAPWSASDRRRQFKGKPGSQAISHRLPSGSAR
jgi:hypothetical protein